eukprot:SAG31_NODE_61_length_29286_cov_444.645973_13_plen_97_part_00
MTESQHLLFRAFVVANSGSSTIARTSICGVTSRAVEKWRHVSGQADSIRFRAAHASALHRPTLKLNIMQDCLFSFALEEAARACSGLFMAQCCCSV